MTEETRLAMLKIDLGITTKVYDSRLNQYLIRAKAEIEREGIKLSDSLDDSSLVIQYAAWMWRKRDTGEGMPRMLRWQMNNRLFAGEKKSNG